MESFSVVLFHNALKDTFVSMFALYVAIWPLQLDIFKHPNNPKLIPFQIQVLAETSV